MSDSLDLAYELVVDRTPQELIGAIGVALILSLLMGSVFLLYRKKVADAFTLTIGLMIVANVLSMLFASVYLVSSWNAKLGAGRLHHPPQRSSSINFSMASIRPAESRPDNSLSKGTSNR